MFLSLDRGLVAKANENLVATYNNTIVMDIQDMVLNIATITQPSLHALRSAEKQAAAIDPAALAEMRYVQAAGGPDILQEILPLFQ